MKELLGDECLNHIFTRLDDIILPAAGSELCEHLFIGGIVLHRDLNPGFLAELVDHRLRDVFRPAENAEFLGFGGFSATDQKGGQCGQDECCGFFHGFLFLLKK